jgi:hypothetical protein
MMENVVAGCVAVALIILALIGFVQTHHECWHGRVLLTHESCGSVTPAV